MPNPMMQPNLALASTGPRYTSYPTIDHCTETIDGSHLVAALQARALGGLKRPLALYVHIPFCQAVCYYCACNKVVTKKYSRATQYLDWLEQEALMIAKAAGSALGPVAQLHLGGGTPSYLSDADLQRLVLNLKRILPFAAGVDMSIEVDPRTVDAARLLHLHSLGFERISLGVQDFDPLVQKAIHRDQPYAMVQGLMQAARRLGFVSVNVDLIYGLPHQVPTRFEHTLQKLLELQPDRVALYGYAHLPTRFKPQQHIRPEDLPSPQVRMKLLAMAIECMQNAGYAYIGMDHFAKPTDALAIAKRQGRLHRNFQGYTVQAETDVVGLGVSAIGQVGALMVQNHRDLETYGSCMAKGEWAVFRGHHSSREDLLRHSVIMAILCQGQVHFDDFSQAHWVQFSEHFAAELAALQPYVEAGFVECNAQGFYLTQQGWFYARPIAMLFDQYSARSQMPRSLVL